MTIESTLLNPGEKWRPDATFDLTKVLSWVSLLDEETRRVRTGGSWYGTTSPGTGAFTNEGMRNVGALENPPYLAEFHEGRTGTRYLDYDGHYQLDPVNQVPDNRIWEPHLCQLAHDVDQFNIDTQEFRRASTFATVPGGAHSAETQIRNQNTMQVFRAVIGQALRKLDRWAKLDPRKGGSGTFSEDWKAQREGIRVIIEEQTCQACEHPYSPREFARLHDYSAWRTVLDHRRVLDEGTGSVIMRVPVIVRDVEPWAPHATENLTFFGGNDVEQGWRTAIEWYDIAVHRYDRLYAPRYVTT